MRMTLKSVALFGLIWASATPAPAATDARFRGTYCGQTQIRECARYRVCFLGFICSNQEHCETLDLRNIRVNVDYREATPTHGVIEGQGSALVQDEVVKLNFGGVVSGHGTANVSVASNFFHPNTGRVTLSADGLALSVHARGQSLTINKNACGNDPPRVTIVHPAEGAVFEFGEIQSLLGSVTEDEDVTFPLDRMMFRSSRDGPLGSGRRLGDRSLSLVTNGLSAGSHVLTFSATDSGGLDSSASVRVTVDNHRPSLLTILQPRPDNTLVAGGPIRFEGQALDREDGVLEGASLVWELSEADGSNVTRLGTGKRFERPIDEPGTYSLQLTAIDSGGATRSIAQTITVQPFTGNTPPRVAIIRPVQVAGLNTVVRPGEQVTFVGSAEDREDDLPVLTTIGPRPDASPAVAPGGLRLRWIADASDPTVPPLQFGTDSTTARVVLMAVGEYLITFRAIDSSGLEASDTIRIFVMFPVS